MRDFTKREMGQISKGCIWSESRVNESIGVSVSRVLRNKMTMSNRGDKVRSKGVRARSA